jgi:hypothetical protein
MAASVSTPTLVPLNNIVLELNFMMCSLPFKPIMLASSPGSLEEFLKFSD